MFDLFEKMGSEADAQNSRSKSRKKPTVSHQFKESLSNLMTLLGSASPFFVRCLKPNMKKVRCRHCRGRSRTILMYTSTTTAAHTTYLGFDRLGISP